MTAFENNILQSLTGKQTLNQVSLKELEEIVSKYPAFAIAQLLLARKLRETNMRDEATIQQTQKTALFFTNTFWLHALLNNSADQLMTAQVFSNPKAEILTNDDFTENIVQPVEEEQYTEEVSPEEEELSDLEASEQKETIHDDEQEEEIEHVLVHEEEESNLSEAPSENDSAPHLVPQNDEILDVEANEDAVSPEEEELSEQEVFAQEDFISEPAAEQIHAAEPNENKKDESQSEKNIVLTGISASGINETKELLLASEHEPESFTVDRIHFSQDLLSSTEDELGDDDEILEQGSNEEIAPGLSKVLSAQIAEFAKPIDDNARLPIEAEPYHTVDYFDSQGIKLDISKSQDKVDKKVRKFTDWLKNMKKNNIQSQDLGTDPEMEHAIQQIAETSNETKEILTETMAEVYIKQGKILNAINLYKKLSFLNPDKTTYFAAKIRQIKDL